MNLPMTSTPDTAEGTDAFRQLELAAAISKRAHSGQYRRDGITPYIEHVMDVGVRVHDFGGDMQALAVAWLHDVLEDTKETEHSLEQAGVSPEIIVAVRALTHRDISYESYIREVRDDVNYRVPLVKLADIISNLADKPTPRQVRKYGEALGVLTSEMTSLKKFSPFTGNTK